MTKTNDAGVPFLGEKRIPTEDYKKNYDKIDWSKHSKDKPKSSEDSRKEKENGKV